jgi:hypothetical protein
MYFNQKFSISAITMRRLGVYNPRLGGGDNKLFIDPKLLELGTDEFNGAHAQLLSYFSTVVRTIKLVQKKNDNAWVAARKKLEFKEITNTSLGYGEEGNDGTGIGPTLAGRIVDRAREILPHVAFEPDVFELIGVFAENIGCDRISDMVVFILLKNFLRYTDRLTTELGISRRGTFTFDGSNYACPKFDKSAKSVLLVPRVFLKPLPIAADYESAMDNADLNEAARKEMNKLIAAAEKDGKSIGKKGVIGIMDSHPSTYRQVIEGYRRAASEPYDFDKDRSRVGDEESIAQEIAGSAKPNIEGLTPEMRMEKCWSDTVEHLSLSIEENRLSDCLFDDAGNPRKEVVAQRLIFAVSKIFGRLYNVDVSRESNAGPGAVDFRYAVGAKDRLLVEVKLSTHKRILDGYYEQLPAYGRAEGIKRLVLLIIRITDDDTAIRRLQSMIAMKTLSIDVVTIDARLKPSASKRKADLDS